MIYHKLCLKQFNHTYCQTLYSSRDPKYKSSQDSIQEQTAQWGIYIDVVKTLPALVATIFYGAWSDRVGRKTVMILPIIGDSLGAIGYILNAYYFDAAVSFLLIGAFISATFGNFAAILLSTFSYIADVSSEQSRTFRVTILESMIYLGSIVSNLCGGWLLQKAGFVAVYGVVLGFYFLQMIYWYFLKESYVPQGVEIQDKFSNLFTRQNFREAFQVFTVKRRQRFRMTLFILLVCFFVLVLCKLVSITFKCFNSSDSNVYTCQK